MEHWTWCKSLLGDVSRTFAIPIGMLRSGLEEAVTCGYLLCRVVDTIEDDGRLSVEEKDALFERFLRAVEGAEEPEVFARAMEDVSGDGPELELARNLPRVMGVLGALPEALQRVVVRWVGEMGRGMALYAHRPAGEDGLVALSTLHDLERYCYFVAGTVGHMLTDLFTEELDLDAAREHALRTHAEEFGLGLQLVNILKDVTDDRERGWCFIPRLVCADQGLEVRDLTDADKRERAHRALAPVFDRAERALDAAFAYCLAIPPSEEDVRRFCLLPLWMAVRTLHVARGNDAQLRAGAPVKITRDEVRAIVRDCMARCGDDEALVDGFAALAAPDWPERVAARAAARHEEVAQ
ncbi:MAG: phytoene/squalene synthase family protein [Myxococcota bacterium]